MTNTAPDIARRAALRLADDLDPSLPAAVDRELVGTAPGQYVDLISLGSLVVSIATLAWTIYRDQRQDQDKASAEVLSRRLRVEIDRPEHVSVDQRDLIIDVVVDEVLHRGSED